MRVEVVQSIATIHAGAWNALNPSGNPFLRHEFLEALETSSCVGPESGWLPLHLACYDETNRLVGATPLYLKNNSYGEYVFDWAWANAYHHAGLPYYPKLVAAVPFTPATGERMLTLPGIDATPVYKALVHRARAMIDEYQASSLHWLFVPGAQQQFLSGQKFMSRTGCQFHWHNADYENFDQFLATFSSKKRKNVKRERRLAKESGADILVHRGNDISAGLWGQFYQFYRATTDAHGAIPYLNREFFLRIGESMPEQIIMITARMANADIAGALFLRSNDTLYGRYWGGIEEIPHVHFELCYYRAIEYCIEHGLQRFEAGAQGEHKINRGLIPVQTCSAHELTHPEFARAVAEYLEREQDHMALYMEELNDHVPYKNLRRPADGSS